MGESKQLALIDFQFLTSCDLVKGVNDKKASSRVGLLS
jgi:hypothetical protein